MINKPGDLFIDSHSVAICISYDLEATKHSYLYSASYSYSVELWINFYDKKIYIT